MEEQTQSQADDPEAALREEAIVRFIQGHKPTHICRELNRSRTWFYNTLARYRQGGREELRSQSRTPKHVHNRIEPDVEAAIVRLRKLILSGTDPDLRYANIGAATLAYELERAGVKSPSRSTIYRVLKRHSLTSPRQRKKKKRKLPDDYPWPNVEAPNELHLLDFVTRSIQGVGRFYGCHLLDQARRWPFLRAEAPKSAAVVSQFLVAAWQEVGLPGGL
jgi:hypothetical protein